MSQNHVRPYDLSGKVALVTGGATGIGLGIADCLAACGADIFLHYRTPRSWLEEHMERWRAAGRRVGAISADFSQDPGQAAAVVEQAVAEMGKIDILVNNAAETQNMEPFLTHTRAGFEAMLAINVTSVFLASQAAARHMIARGQGGRIVNISSVQTRMSEAVAYATSKGAIEALSLACAQALAGYGITVNAVAPGPVLTETWEEQDPHCEAGQKRVPVGRYGLPSDIGWTVAFLASNEAEFITSETLFVDGGLSHKLH